MMVPFSPNLLPEWVKEGKIRAFCGWGFNVMIWPQPEEYAKAISKLDSRSRPTTSTARKATGTSTSSCPPP